MPNISDADLAKLKKDIATAAGQQVAEEIRKQTNREIELVQKAATDQITRDRDEVKACTGALNAEIIAFGSILAPLHKAAADLCGVDPDPLPDPGMTDLEAPEGLSAQYIHGAIANLRTAAQHAARCVQRIAAYQPPPDRAEEIDALKREVMDLKARLETYRPTEETGNNPDAPAPAQ